MRHKINSQLKGVGLERYNNFLSKLPGEIKSYFNEASNENEFIGSYEENVLNIFYLITKPNFDGNQYRLLYDRFVKQGRLEETDSIDEEAHT
jgi:hypothetical protein